MPQKLSAHPLSRIRREIDALDRELVAALNRRARLVEAVRKEKKKLAIPVRDPAREKAILGNVRKRNRGPLPDEALEEMFARLIDGYRSWEAKRTAAPSTSPSVSDDRKRLRGKTVAIHGLGLMGGSFLLALKKAVPTARFLACDIRPPAHPAIARALMKFETEPRAVLDADILVLGAPVGATLEFLRRYGRRVRQGTLVLDLGSTKKAVCDAAAGCLGPGAVFVGGHPLAGKATPGAQHADPCLFEGRPFILSAGSRGEGSEGIELASALARTLGAMPVLMSAEEHDQVLASSSHLPQFLSTALAIVARDARARHGERFVSGPALEGMTRLAASDYAMWRDIARTNAPAIDEALGKFVETLERLRRGLADGDFEKEFKSAGEYLAGD